MDPLSIDLNVVKWLRKTLHVEFSPTIVSFAAMCGYIDIFDYLLGAGCECSEDVVDKRIKTLLYIANVDGTVAIPDVMVVYLINAGYKFTTGWVDLCTESGNHELAEWLREIGCPK